MPKRFLRLRVIPGEEAPVKELVDVYVANIAGPQASQLVKLLGQIAPLAQFDHLKRVRKQPHESSSQLQIILLLRSQSMPQRPENSGKTGTRAFALAEANEASGGVCNAAVIVDPISGEVIAEAQDNTKQHPLRHAIMAAIDAAAARDRRLWPLTSSQTQETSAAHKPSLPSHSTALDDDAIESDLSAKRRCTSAAGSFHETLHEDQRLSVSTHRLSPGLSSVSSSPRQNPASSTNHSSNWAKLFISVQVLSVHGI
ncbi:hypothetical protein WJX82_002447 [Trebouxia sp. C0006]